jgi:hypothetical protein
MSQEAIHIVKFIFGAIAGLFGIAAAFFRAWEVKRNDYHEPIREWFRRKWISINNSFWLALPEKVINWLLRFVEFVNKNVLLLYSSLMLKIGDNKRNHLAILFIFSIARIIALFALLNVFTFNVGSFSDDAKTALFIVLTIYLFGVVPSIISRITKTEIFWIKNFGIITYKSIFAIYSALLMFFPYLSYALSLPIERTMIHIFTISFSIFFTYTVVLQSHFNLERFKAPHNKFKYDKIGEYIKFFMFSFSISLIITSSSLWLGKACCPNLEVSKTLQLFLSNAIFDCLTVVTTILLLKWAIKKSTIYRIPLAILFDIIFSAIWACFSLFFGLLGKENALSFNEVLNVLVAKSPNGIEIELGPYFWMMHTTFLPTLIYCFFILTSWICKAILIPIKYFFGIGQETKNPLKLTMTICLIFVAIFSFLSYLTGLFQQ